MKNGDKPASPTGHSQSGTGLTKREAFAMAAMQGLMAGLYAVPDLTGWKEEDFAHFAVKQADALLQALEK